MTSRPVLIVFSVLAGLQVLTAGATLAEVIGLEVAGVSVLVVAATQAGMTFYVQGLVTPLANARDNDGTPLVRADHLEGPKPDPDYADPGIPENGDHR